MIPQQTIAHYRITAKLGEGGMGAVYRATDTKLNREVAIKVLPDAFAADPDRMARFTREAQVLASLNHPNIGAIYGVEERALVLELIEGAELRGPLSEAETLAVLQQLIDALEYAHEHGVIHRDLKPANLKLTPDGRLKVLDFGLAKAMSGEAAGSDPASSPTLTMRATMTGVIMGTAAYMSPEQARGRNVDKRADIWAFGAVAYELLTGEHLFRGDTVSETLAAVLRDEPDFSPVPPRFQRLLRLCLTRDPSRRLRDISGARLLLEEAPPAAIPPAPAPRRSLLPWAVAVLSVAVILLAAALWRRGAGAEATLKPMLRFNVDLGPQARRSSHVTAILSPDGSSMLFYSGETYPQLQLASRRLDQARAGILPGTTGANDPFFSPDGQWIGFFADEKLKKVSTQGGAAITICPTDLGGQTTRGAWWGEDGTIVATLDNGRLFRVPATGGQPQPLGLPKDHGDRAWTWPQILPDGDTVLFTAPEGRGARGFDDARIKCLSLKTGKTKVVYTGGYFGRYLPSGHLVYVHEGTLFAVRFDPARLEIKGTPVPVLDDIAGTAGIGAGEFDYTRNGMFAYLAGSSLDVQRPAVWTDATGHVEPLVAPPAGVTNPRFSPNGKLLALMSGSDLAVYDVARDTLTKPTFSGGGHPAWMPDSKRLIYTSASGLTSVRADGSGQPEVLLETGKDALPYATSVSPDGRWLAYYRMNTATGFDLWMLPLDSTDPEHLKAGSPQIFVQEPGHETHPMFSPDGRFVAYASTQAGHLPEVFVRPATGVSRTGAGGKWQISSSGGRFPVWSRSGNQLFFLGPDYHIMTVPYSTAGDTFVPGKPHEWSPTQVWFPGTQWDFDITPDGKRAVILAAPAQDPANSTVHVTVLLNFFDELKRRLP